jgi:hypothetical protein
MGAGIPGVPVGISGLAWSLHGKLPQHMLQASERAMGNLV